MFADAQHDVLGHRCIGRMLEADDVLAGVVRNRPAVGGGHGLVVDVHRGRDDVVARESRAPSTTVGRSVSMPDSPCAQSLRNGTGQLSLAQTTKLARAARSWP